MNKIELKELLVLIMCSDPWPCDEANHSAIIALADRVSKEHGYENWVVAYHELPG
jgi:hypothetical protein